MVDAIGVNRGASEPMVRIASVAATPVVKAPLPDTGPDTGSAAAATEASVLTRTMASEAPVDTDRVARIRKAIANGTFPILPATIADRLMALRLEWNSDDKA